MRGKRKYEVSIGDKFGLLTVLNIEYPKEGERIIECQCNCGNITKVRISDLCRGKSKSCGCLIARTARKVHLKHAFARTINRHPLYVKWNSLRRFKNSYKEWFNNPEVYMTYLASKGCTKNSRVVRIDKSRGYYPDNIKIIKHVLD